MTKSQIKVCIDRRPLPKTHAQRMALVKGSLWQRGDAIRITFLDGDPLVRERVKAAASVWMNHANLRLYFTDDPAADVRISFAGQGSWSYIGTDCKAIPGAQPTMNYGWLDANTPDDEVSRVVLHEFGHALGCIHEHQSPAGGIHWDKDKVYAYYAGPPNYWKPEEVDRNLFQLYSEDVTVHTTLDPASIMMYPIDASFTTDGFEVGWNRMLSATDKQFIAQMYPR